MRPGAPLLCRPAAAAIALTTALVGCKPPATEPPPPPPPEVTVVEVQPKDTPVLVEFVGKTASSRRVEVRARVEGFLERRHYEEGTMVEEGALLFEMDKKPLAAELQAAEAELAQQIARVETAEANLNRIEPLVEKNAVAQKDLDDAVGTFREASAAVEAARAKVVQAKLNLGYCDIHAPVSGLSSYAVQQEGAYIGSVSDSLLTYVAQIDPMWVEFSVSENQILKSRAAEDRGLLAVPEGDLEVEIVLADGTVYPDTGRITFADASLSEETGTFLLRAEIDNTDHLLRPGQFVRINLKGAYRPDAIVVPQRAVQQGAQGSFVWVIDDGQAELRPVVVSAWYADDWFIDEGLTAGDQVVVDGAAKLQAGVPVTIVAARDESQKDE